MKLTLRMIKPISSLTKKHHCGSIFSAALDSHYINYIPGSASDMSKLVKEYRTDSYFFYMDSSLLQYTDWGFEKLLSVLMVHSTTQVPYWYFLWTLQRQCVSPSRRYILVPFCERGYSCASEGKRNWHLHSTSSEIKTWGNPFTKQWKSGSLANTKS
jgi:hypothetical protein